MLDAVLGGGDIGGKETVKSPEFGWESQPAHIISNNQAALPLQRKRKQCRAKGIEGAILERASIRKSSLRT